MSKKHPYQIMTSIDRTMMERIAVVCEVEKINRAEAMRRLLELGWKAYSN